MTAAFNKGLEIEVEDIRIQHRTFDVSPEPLNPQKLFKSIGVLLGAVDYYKERATESLLDTVTRDVISEPAPRALTINCEHATFYFNAPHTQEKKGPT